MHDTAPLTSHSLDYRNKIRSRLKRQEAFKQFLAVWVGVTALLIGIWFFTTPFGYFWPVWPMLGMSIPAVILWWSAYGTPPKEITDADIDAEIQRIRGNK